MGVVKIWTEISEERLAGNFRALQRILAEDAGAAGAIPLLAVVKANAYGHGIVPCAGVLAQAGADWLGVTDAHEGARVREALRKAVEPTPQNRDVGHSNPRLFPSPEILVMSGTAGLAGEAECIVRERLTAVIWDAGQVERLAQAARAAGLEAPVRVHLEVDSGMSRQGVASGAELDVVLRGIAGEPRIALDGVMTHFASTEVAGSEQTAAQQRSFEGAIAQVAEAGMRPGWMHVGNSSYIDNGSIAGGAESLCWLRDIAGRIGARAMVRSGLALYGYLLPIEGPGRSAARGCVRPVMTWKTRVIGVREVPAGALVGYNGTFAAERRMRLALLPVGYADGLRRELSSCNTRPGNARTGGWVMVRGERAPIVGRVSMNLTTVDVTGIAGVVPGDEVVLIGGGASAEDHARIAGTIAYEILCGVRTSE
jgi:alanine racemase